MSPAAGARPPPRVRPALSPRAAGASLGEAEAGGSSHGARGGTERVELFLTCSVTRVSAPWEREPAGPLGAAGTAPPPARWPPAPEGGRAPRPARKPCGPVGLPSRASPGAFPSHPGLVGAGGAASPQTSALAPMPAAMMDRWLCGLGSGNPPSSGPPARDGPFFDLRLGGLRGPPSALAISLLGPQVDLEKRGSPPSEQIREHGAWAVGGRPSRPAEPSSGPGWFCPELFPCIRVT